MAPHRRANQLKWSSPPTMSAPWSKDCSESHKRGVLRRSRKNSKSITRDTRKSPTCKQLRTCWLMRRAILTWLNHLSSRITIQGYTLIIKVTILSPYTQPLRGRITKCNNPSSMPGNRQSPTNKQSLAMSPSLPRRLRYRLS